MRNVFYLIPFILIISSASTTKKNKNSSTQNEIVFIFKKNDFKSSSIYKTVDGRVNPIYISEKGNFNRSEIIINNQLKNDTIKKICKQDTICLTYSYDGFKSYIYEFQKGDTVVFDYEKGIPRATVLGRKTKNFDCNFEATFKIQKPLEYFEFNNQNKRNRNESETKNYNIDLQNYRLKNEHTLDSLFALDLISKSIMVMHKGRTKYYEMNVNKDLLASISSDDLKRDDLLYLRTYQFFLENYIKEQLKDPSTKSQSYNPKTAFDYVLTNNAFSAKIKDFLLFSNLSIIIQSLPHKESEVYVQKFKKAIENKELYDAISEKYALDFAMLKYEKKVVYLVDTKKQKLTSETLFSKNKGKVIYIDFWASWCFPCRKAMPSFNNLKRAYKDKEVVFVNISIDKDLATWKTASDMEKLTINNTNFLALNYPAAQFYQDLKLKTIPRYLLYNKKGELVNSDAPHPDSPEIEKELDKLLSE